ncbi:MAG: hypothetical protein NVV59_19700 [Chitinophagaceae bacterium]|nr:hypothetical protein [Chitinophagaceae bacterium]
MISRRFFFAAICCVAIVLPAFAQKKSPVHFVVSLEKPATQTMQISMELDWQQTGPLQLKMPVWSPGYYQRLNYAQYVSGFSARDAAGNNIAWKKADESTWEMTPAKKGKLKINYEVKAAKAFVAQSWLDSSRGYIIPGAVCFYPKGEINRPINITIRPFAKWTDMATGLDRVKGKANTFFAEDYDVLYDSPILVGNLDSLKPFDVNGVPHYFTGHKLGEFDKESFIADLKAITSTSAALIGDIPFKHYTFIGIGPGAGGIEHLNSTTISFTGRGLDNRAGKIKMLNFIAHEYFHHYNAKRIRPFELGPFDYENGNRTNLLWIAEGLTVYYEYLILRRAGITTEEELLSSVASNIRAHETREGKLYQSLVQASYETWSDGPFGRTGDGAKKTISYYDKGPVVGMLLDFTIRHHSGNKKSLDDVMRYMYHYYYKEKGRGYTDAEFQMACEAAAGTSLATFFEYVHTVKELDYDTILAYAGLQLDRENYELKKLPSLTAAQSAIWGDWSRNRRSMSDVR